MVALERMAVRRVLEERAEPIRKADEALYSGIAWTGLLGMAIGATWVLNWSPGLRPYGHLADILGVVLMCVGLGVAYGAGVRNSRLRRWSAVACALVLAVAAVLIALDSNGSGAATYSGLAGLCAIWALRTG